MNPNRKSAYLNPIPNEGDKYMTDLHKHDTPPTLETRTNWRTLDTFDPEPVVWIAWSDKDGYTMWYNKQEAERFSDSQFPVRRFPPVLRIPEPMTNEEIDAALDLREANDEYEISRAIEDEVLRRVKETNDARSVD